jgi:hypothetical protein
MFNYISENKKVAEEAVAAMAAFAKCWRRE